MPPVRTRWFPSPQPSPRGEGERVPALYKPPFNGFSNASERAPSSRGEGWGEGNAMPEMNGTVNNSTTSVTALSPVALPPPALAHTVSGWAASARKHSFAECLRDRIWRNPS
jgi:hypothetical protein